MRGRARRSETLRPIVRYAPTLPSPAGGKRLARGVCRERRLLIELDGGQHAERPEYRHRDRATCALGYAVICIGNNNVIDNLDGFSKRSGLDSKNGPSPRPSPHKRGEEGSLTTETHDRHRMATAASPVARARRLDRCRGFDVAGVYARRCTDMGVSRRAKSRSRDELIANGTADTFEAAKAAALFEARAQSSE